MPVDIEHDETCLPACSCRADAYIDLAVERDMAEAYYKALEQHLRHHGCQHDFADIAERPEDLTDAG